MTTAVRETSLPLPLVRRGKVRDVYAVDADRLLLVTTDRISAFDVVMDEAIPYKGVVLTQLTAWWLGQLGERVAHHLISADTDEIIAAVPSLASYRDVIAGRAMLCVAADVVPIECVIRGYITGSAWKEYRAQGTLAGEPLAAGLRESDRLTPPIFSPATKAETGHDENITIDQVIASVGPETAADLERLARTVYEFGRAMAEPRGIIVADTKFEFGWRRRRVAVHRRSADARQFALLARRPVYEPGHGQPSFDKQPLRDWLDQERDGLAGGTETRRRPTLPTTSSPRRARATSMPSSA
jgi:phosphoribosylaminoimidazole-succinocarboxamide synthase